ncbi:MAG: hypothetical protein K2Q01_12480 [Rickettsiales bacterium]|nr:hypothetical protein [Rickettsiales bacterium]
MAKDKQQVDKFIETAKELGCDESEAAFNEKLKKLAKQQPEPEKPKGKKE